MQSFDVKRTIGTLVIFCLCAASLAIYVSNTFDDGALPAPESSLQPKVQKLHRQSLDIDLPRGDGPQRLPAVTRTPFEFGE